MRQAEYLINNQILLLTILEDGNFKITRGFVFGICFIFWVMDVDFLLSPQMVEGLPGILAPPFANQFVLVTFLIF